MDNTEQPNELSGIGFDELSNQHLRAAITWAKLTGVVGLFSLLLISISNWSTLEDLSKLRTYDSGKFYFTFYLICTLLYFVLSFLLNFFLLRFSVRTKMGLDEESPDLIEGGLKNMESYLKVMSIFIFLVLAFFLYGILKSV